MNKALPYDGWYNGNIDKMIGNGTYADFRDVLAEKAELGKIDKKLLAKADKEWDALSLEEKLRRRAVVVGDQTPHEKVIHITGKGPVTIKNYREPSDDNNLSPDRNRRKGKKKVKMPDGALTDENNPLVKNPA